jgi:Phage terminase large subunit (GpA)
VDQAFIDRAYSSAVLDQVPSYSEFAPTVTLPDGKFKGNSLVPMPSQECILQAMDAGYRHIIICKPVQDGATTIALVPLMRRAIREHQTALLCYPTGDSAKDIWTTKTLPVLLIYGGQEPKSGGGSKGGAARVVTLPGGGRFMLRSGGGRGESNQASVSGDCMLVDELDDWPDARTILNVRKRIKESPDPLLMEMSTIKKDHGSLVLNAWTLGTKSHLEFPCIHCGAFQQMLWEQVDLERCTYVCFHCKTHWTELDRLVSLTSWKRVDENPQATAFSLRWSALDSPLSKIREEIHGTVSLPGYLSALRAVENGDHSEMRSFNRDRLARIYEGDTQAEEGDIGPLTKENLARRSMAFGWARPVVDIHPEKIWSRYVTDAPPLAECAVVAVDVQQDRLYWVCIAFSFAGSTWDLAWGQERCRMRKVGEILEPEPWGPGDLSQTLSRLDAFLPEITSLPIKHKIIDTRYEGQELASWLKNNHLWRALIGVGTLAKVDPEQQNKKRRILLPNLLAYDNLWLPRLGRFEIVTERARERVHAAYRKSPSEPGAAMLPGGLPTNDHYIRHLCSWLLETDPKTNQTKWVRKQKRDDHLDCRCYAQALILFEAERHMILKRAQNAPQS